MRPIAGAILLLALAAPAHGQQTGATQPPRAAAADTLRELVEWAEPDSLMRALLARAGVVVTRYQGDSVAYDTRTRTLRLDGGAAVERAPSLLVGDTIIFDDSARVLYARAVRGGIVVLRDPTQGDDVRAGGIVYDLDRRAGVVTDIRTAVESGERWYLHAARAATQQADTALRQENAFFGRHGQLTSCDLEEPHYHFRATEIKMISRNILVARPAVLYIADIPVAALPFVFQDLRSGRRSGILPPRVGLSDIVRTGSNYRRHIQNVGYYFAINDYTDAQISLDWRSSARPRDLDPGWIRYNGRFDYKWLDRFIDGNFGASHHRIRDGSTNTAVSWFHSQRFTEDRRLSMTINYMTNTMAHHRHELIPAAVLATISSRGSYQQRLGPASVSIGGSRTQYSGRPEVQQTFPTLSISTPTLNLAPWLSWTPQLSLTGTQSLHQQQIGGAVPFRYVVRPDGEIDSVRTRLDSRSTTMSLASPLEIFGFRWSNSIAVRDDLNDFPMLITVRDVQDSSVRSDRVFAQTFRTTVDWQTSFSLRPFFQGTWNLSPGIAVVNVTPDPFLIRNQHTGGAWVAQGKRLQYSLSASPTFYGLLPGIGPVERIRHKLSPRLSYSFAPASSVGDDFLRALNRTRAGDLTGLRQNAINLGLQQNFEGRLRSASDTGDLPGAKVTLLTMDFSGIGFDFERAAELRRRAAAAGTPPPGGFAGFTTERFGYSLSSGLLPGASLRVDYSLFEGSPQSDTARFAPYREGIEASFQLNRASNPLVWLTRLFGQAVPPASPAAAAEPGDSPQDSLEVQRLGVTPVAGSWRQRELMVPTGGDWSASVSFSSRRQRPPRGVDVLIHDPTLACQSLLWNPLLYQLCVEQERQASGGTDTTSAYRPPGAPVYRMPPQTTARMSTSFNLTSLWATQWETTYDFEAGRFGSHQVSLQRDMHDWRAIFAFTQAPNGNFAFNFFIALKAQPDLKFDYNRQTYRTQ